VQGGQSEISTLFGGFSPALAFAGAFQILDLQLQLLPDKFGFPLFPAVLAPAQNPGGDESGNGNHESRKADDEGPELDRVGIDLVAVKRNDIGMTVAALADDVAEQSPGLKDKIQRDQGNKQRHGGNSPEDPGIFSVLADRDIHQRPPL